MSKKEINKYLEYLSTLSIKELKQAYLLYEVSWIYIAELKERQYISEEEMNYIVGYWK